MTLTFGFYNSFEGDRTYDALQMSRIFNGVIEDGVFASIGDYLRVFANSGLNVAVGTGRAWFNDTWSYNDGDVILTLDTADPILPRIDVIYLEINHDVNVRENSLNILKGVPAESPSPGSLTQTSLIHQYPLAYILVEAGETTIQQGDITNKVGSSATPFVTGPLSVIDTDDLILQWQDQFETWFDFMKDQLSEDAAGNLQLQINEIVGDTNPPLIDLIEVKNHDHTTLTSQIPTEGIEDDAITTPKIDNNAVTAAKIPDRDLYTYIDPNGCNTALATVKIDHDYLVSAIGLEDDQESKIYWKYQVPEKWVSGTDIQFQINWYSSMFHSVWRWNLYYYRIYIGEDFTGVTPYLLQGDLGDVGDPPYNVAWSILGNIPNSYIVPGMQLVGVLGRDYDHPNDNNQGYVGIVGMRFKATVDS